MEGGAGEPLLTGPNEIVAVAVTQLSTASNSGENDASISTSTFLQATINSMSLLFGIGMLSIPYALERGGLLSLLILLVFGAVCCYTAYILGFCLESARILRSYQDIGAKAYGLNGRIIVTIFLYADILAVLVGYTISLGDNLAKIFPHVNLDYSWLHLTGAQFMAIIAILIIFPTVWLRNLSSLSYLSLGGISLSLVIPLCLAWVGIYGGIGFSHSIPITRTSNIPAVSGLYAYCYSGHIVFPTIYRSMKDPSKYVKVLLLSFSIVTVVYIGMAFMGALMFGDAIQSQVTLNMPEGSLATRIALWVIVITPITKYALSIAPLSLELEGLLPRTLSKKSQYLMGILIRTSFLIAILLVALIFPFFAYVLSFIGSALSITMAIILPCVFYMKIFYDSMSSGVILMNAVFAGVGIVFGVMGTISSLKSLIESIRGSP